MYELVERPILFSGAMVEAIVAGRKTMTRRVLKPQPELFRHSQDDPAMGSRRGDLCRLDLYHEEGRPWPRVQLGRVITNQEVRYKVGTRLWVRETWAETQVFPIVETIDRPMVVYRAADNRTDYGGPWRPAIHMPRSAARLVLDVTAVRIERLQDITPQDATKEGVEGDLPPLESFASLWSTIYSPDAWTNNPVVAVITFGVGT